MTHNTAILKHLKRYHDITPMEALRKFRCLRLSARIYDLRQQGHDIVTVPETHKHKGVTKTYARYVLQ